MPKRKHVKKNIITPCTDANQHIRERNAERARKNAAMQTKIEMFREQYEAEMKRRELQSKSTASPTVLNPTVTPDIGDALKD